MNYYNEFDPNAAAWLRELIAQKLIPAGEVDERSITDVQATDLLGYTQCHFFAGIGGWSFALQLAGWPQDKPVWTGSCPCQPYSAAGKGLGDEDPRNLWPAFFRLIRQRRPVAVFGEQVAEAIGKGWLDRVSADLEGEGYACGAVVLGAHSVLAPHIRQRLYWVANSEDSDRWGEQPEVCSWSGWGGSSGSSPVGRMADRERPRLQGHAGDVGDRNQPGRIDAHAVGSTAAGGATLRLGDATSGGFGVVGNEAQPGSRGHADSTGNPSSGLADMHGDGRDQGRAGVAAARDDGSIGNGFWSDSRWIYCRDGKHRRIPTEPALFPLADGLPYKLARRGSIRPALLKGSGNAIVPEVAAQFIQAFMQTISQTANHPTTE